MNWLECVTLIVFTNFVTGVVTWSRTHKANYEAANLPPKVKQYPPEGRPVEGSIWHDNVGQTYILAGDDWKLL